MNKSDGLRFFVTLLGFILLFIQLQMPAQGGGTQIATEQVKQAVGEIQKLCENEIKEGAVPGLALAVVHQDQVVYAAGFGVRDVNTQEPVNADTVFQLGSLSKPIGSTLVAQLVGEGKISWDSKISELDPDFEMYDPWVTREITIRDFYSHRSGLPDHAGDLLEDLGFSRKEILRLLRYERARPERDNLGSRRIMGRQLRRLLAALFRIHFPLTAGGMVAPPQPRLAPRTRVVLAENLRPDVSHLIPPLPQQRKLTR